MRIDRLYLPLYRNLREFTIDIDQAEPITVLIGRNGSGKSNLVEAVVEIFRDLEMGEPPRFAYVIEYVCRNHSVRIDADPARSTRRLDIVVDGKTLPHSEFLNDADAYLPSYVFAYYSGWSSRLERHFDRLTP